MLISFLGPTHDAVCAIARDEPDLQEWVAYQMLIGFERIVIYDHRSVVPISTVLEPLNAAFPGVITGVCVCVCVCVCVRVCVRCVCS